MKIHSDILTERDLHKHAPEGIIVQAARHGSRKRAHGWDAYLEYWGPRSKGDGRKLRNSDNEGAKQGTVTATYDEHGEWMAELFAIDPDAIISRYDGRADFERQTAGKYRAKAPA